MKLIVDNPDPITSQTRINLVDANRLVKQGELEDVLVLGVHPKTQDLVLFASGQSEAEIVYLLEQHKIAVLASDRE